MNKRLSYVLLAIMMVAVSFPLHAGKGVDRGYRYENVQNRSFWLNGWNAAGMREDSLTISQATLNAKCAFKDWNAGADAQTILHLKKFSMVGSFTFDQKMMYDACGSMFVTPGRYPVDMIEFTPGTKSKQNYAFTGGISVDLGGGWALGGQFDYSATNYTKRKDLRYSNFALDLSVRPAVVYRQGDLTFGAALRLDRNTETIKAEQIGASAESYYAFLGKGQYFGLEKVWDSDVLHLSESGINNFPVHNIGYGGALEFAYRGFFAELTYLYGNGRVGEKDATWYKFPTHDGSVTLGYKWPVAANGVEKWMRVDGRFRRQMLNEAVIEKTTEGGVTTRTTYGFNNIGNGSEISVTPVFQAVRPGKFQLKASLDWTRSDELSSIKYPVLAGQSLSSIGAGANGRIMLGPWDVILGIAAVKGWLNTMQNQDDSKLPYRQQEYYQAWKDYNTSLRFSAEVGTRYTFGNRMFLEMAYGLMTSTKTNHAVSLSVGYTF